MRVHVCVCVCACVCVCVCVCVHIYIHTHIYTHIYAGGEAGGGSGAVGGEEARVLTSLLDPLTFFLETACSKLPGAAGLAGLVVKADDPYALH
jgi:hypothetical protein